MLTDRDRGILDQLRLSRLLEQFPILRETTMMLSGLDRGLVISCGVEAIDLVMDELPKLERWAWVVAAATTIVIYCNNEKCHQCATNKSTGIGLNSDEFQLQDMTVATLSPSTATATTQTSDEFGINSSGPEPLVGFGAISNKTRETKEQIIERLKGGNHRYFRDTETGDFKFTIATAGALIQEWFQWQATRAEAELYASISGADQTGYTEAWIEQPESDASGESSTIVEETEAKPSRRSTTPKWELPNNLTELITRGYTKTLERLLPSSKRQRTTILRWLLKQDDAAKAALTDIADAFVARNLASQDQAIAGLLTAIKKMSGSSSKAKKSEPATEDGADEVVEATA